MSLPPRTTLGPYEILTPTGAGGMDEVYRAWDTELGRAAVSTVCSLLSSTVRPPRDQALR